MAPSSSTTIIILPLLCTFFCFLSSASVSLADVPPSPPMTPSAACNSTPDPAFCKSLLPQNQSSDIYNYGRFSLAKSLSNAHKFSNLIDRYFARRSSLTQPTIRALEDCKLLSNLNIEFLTTASASLTSTTTKLLDAQADELQTLLSALQTNQLTCLDSLRAITSAWSISDGIATPLLNGTKIYSVSLALFTKAWVPKAKRAKTSHGFVPGKRHGGHPKRRLLFHQVEVGKGSSGLPLKMSDRNRFVFESRTGRGLLQSPSDQVMVTDMVVVSKDGSGDYERIGDAVASAPNNTDGSKGYYLIYVDAGVYEEYVSIPKNKKYLMMIGDGINRTVITGNHSFVDGWTTFNSATFAVVGEGFVGMNLTIQNTAGAAKHQAVALRNGADLSTFYNCSFEGYQDTLYAHSMRQFYRECDVYGTVDYVFGNAAAVLQNCNFFSRLPMEGQSNTITAQGRTDPNQNTGTSIHNCSFLAAPDLSSNTNWSTKSYLGRPWKQYSRTVVMLSFMDASIDPAGWMPWDGNFALDTLYYAEYNNTGPGSSTDRRVSWPGFHVINSTDANNFTVSNFLSGQVWLPQTGVPYFNGLL